MPSSTIDLPLLLQFPLSQVREQLKPLCFETEKEKLSQLLRRSPCSHEKLCMHPLSHEEVRERMRDIFGIFYF